MQLLLLVGSVVLATLGVLTCWLSGRRQTRVLGVSLALCTLAVCVPYNAVTGQYGFIVSNLVIGAIHTRNLRHALRERTEFTDLTTHRYPAGTAPTDR